MLKVTRRLTRKGKCIVAYETDHPPFIPYGYYIAEVDARMTRNKCGHQCVINIQNEVSYPGIGCCTCRCPVCRRFQDSYGTCISPAIYRKIEGYIIREYPVDHAVIRGNPLVRRRSHSLVSTVHDAGVPEYIGIARRLSLYCTDIATCCPV